MLSAPDNSPHSVLLTFDDGPHPLHTVSLLDELRRRGLNAVFFVLGESLELPVNRAILERAAGEGHFIGNHGYSHQMLTGMTEDQIRADFRRTEALIGGLDRGVKLWRPPFGDRDSRVDAVLASLGYTRMLWNVDSLDWDAASPVPWVQRTLERIRLRQARGFRNTVCLLHDKYSGAAAHLSGFLDRLAELPNTRTAEYDPWQVDAVSFEFAGARVVARDRISAMYVLNESAGVVWDALAAGASPAEIALALAGKYEISQDVASHDVENAIARWRAAGLLGPKAIEAEAPAPWLRSIKEVARVSGVQFEEKHDYRFLDVHFRICFQTAQIAREIHPRFANLEVRETGTTECVFEVASRDGGYVLDLPDAVATSHASLAGLAYELFFEIMRVAHPDLDLMACLHSALIGWDDGAIALVGNNGSGKSTLSAALVSSGRQALSDDRLFLDFATGLPVAAPNAIGVKRGSWQPLLSRYPDLLQLPVMNQGAEEVRFLLPQPPSRRQLPPVRSVFFPAYRATATTAAVPLTSVEALARITAAEGWISSDLPKVGAFLRWLESVHCYDFPFSSLDAAMERIAECL
jgi:peptidoglycan/xylan/chitin deacetylase (PgdA/CDA1 family)